MLKEEFIDCFHKGNETGISFKRGTFKGLSHFSLIYINIHNIKYLAYDLTTIDIIQNLKINSIIFLSVIDIHR